MATSHGTPHSPQRRTLLHLPDDIQETISIYLGREDALNLSSTCRRLRQVVLLALNAIVLAECLNKESRMIPSDAEGLEIKALAQQSQSIQRTIVECGGWSLLIVFWLQYKKFWHSEKQLLLRDLALVATLDMEDTASDVGDIEALSSLHRAAKQLIKDSRLRTTQRQLQVSQNDFITMIEELYIGVKLFMRPQQSHRSWLKLSNKIFLLITWHDQGKGQDWDLEIFA